MTDDRHNINNDTERVAFEPLLNVYKMHLRVSETAVLFYAVLEEGRDANLFLLTKFKTIQFSARKVKTI